MGICFLGVSCGRIHRIKTQVLCFVVVCVCVCCDEHFRFSYNEDCWRFRVNGAFICYIIDESRCSFNIQI